MKLGYILNYIKWKKRWKVIEVLSLDNQSQQTKWLHLPN